MTSLTKQAAPAPISPLGRRAFTVLNSSSAPLFLAMILAPRARLTRRLIGAAMPLQAALGVSYAGLLASGMVRLRAPLDFRDPQQLRRMLAEEEIFLAGWAHYISFDLFVGQWIWRDSLERGRSARLALFLTWMAGPMGLTLYTAQRTWGRT